MTIIKGQPFKCVVTIKEDNSPTGLALTEGDTGTFIISKAYPVIEQLLVSTVTISDAASGKVQIVLSANETATLPAEQGNPEDGSKALATCKGLLRFPTPAGLDAVGKFDKIYIEDVGI